MTCVHTVNKHLLVLISSIIPRWQIQDFRNRRAFYETRQALQIITKAFIRIKMSTPPPGHLMFQRRIVSPTVLFDISFLSSSLLVISFIITSATEEFARRQSCFRICRPSVVRSDWNFKVTGSKVKVGETFAGRHNDGRFADEDHLILLLLLLLLCCNWCTGWPKNWHHFCTPQLYQILTDFSKLFHG